jgi:Phage portal protein, SPP1 Gp6-like
MIDPTTFGVADGDQVPYLAAVPPVDNALERAIQWRDQLEKSLDSRQSRLRKYDAYYRGDHNLKYSSEKFRKQFGFLYREFADNFCDVVVDKLSERLRPTGIRMGAAATQGDTAAWTIWQRNGLDADSELAHKEAFIKEQSYGMVWWETDANGNVTSPARAQITVEDATEVILACAPENRRKRLAALKKWIDEDGYAHCELYLPGEIYKWISPKKVDTFVTGEEKIQWKPYAEPGEPWPLPNKLGVVPVVALRNNPRLRRVQSELEQIIPMQDYLNFLLANAAVASEGYAYRQRYATGLKIPLDPKTNQPVEELKMAQDRVWTSADPNSKFGEFGETNLGNYVQMIDLTLRHIAVKSATPAHYFDVNGQFPSGDALTIAEAPLVRKAELRSLHFGESWEEIIRLAFLVEGDKQKANITDSEMIWRDFEIRSLTQLADSLVKLQSVGFPDEYLWALGGASPQDIARFKQMRAEEPPVPPTERVTLTGPAPSEAEQIAPAGQDTATAS